MCVICIFSYAFMCDDVLYYTYVSEEKREEKTYRHQPNNKTNNSNNLKTQDPSSDPVNRSNQFDLCDACSHCWD